MWSHNKGAVGGRTSRLRAINFCLSPWKNG